MKHQGISFEEYYAKYFREHIYFLRKKFATLSHQEAQDIVQDSFIKVYQGWANFDPAKSKLKTWICSVVQNDATDFIRKKQAKFRGNQVSFSAPIGNDSKSLTTVGDMISDPSALGFDEFNSPTAMDLLERILMDKRINEKQRTLLYALIKLQNEDPKANYKKLAAVISRESAVEVAEGTVKAIKSYAIQNCKDAVRANGIRLNY